MPAYKEHVDRMGATPNKDYRHRAVSASRNTAGNGPKCAAVVKTMLPSPKPATKAQFADDRNELTARIAAPLDENNTLLRELALAAQNAMRSSVR